MEKEIAMAILEDDMLKHHEAPDDELIEAMYGALVGSDSKEYVFAH